jgi:hypothetical protein
VLIVMLPLPPNGVALALGAATWLVRTAQVGPTRLVMSGVLVEVTPMIKPAQTTNAPMTLMMNALVPMIAPCFLYRPGLQRDADTTGSALADTVKCRLDASGMPWCTPNR